MPNEVTGVSRQIGRRVKSFAAADACKRTASYVPHCVTTSLAGGQTSRTQEPQAIGRSFTRDMVVLDILS